MYIQLKSSTFQANRWYPLNVSKQILASFSFQQLFLSATSILQLTEIACAWLQPLRNYHIPAITKSREFRFFFFEKRKKAGTQACM